MAMAMAQRILVHLIKPRIYKVYHVANVIQSFLLGHEPQEKVQHNQTMSYAHAFMFQFKCIHANHIQRYVQHSSNTHKAFGLVLC